MTRQLPAICPRCGYDLDAVSDGACPECGRQFQAETLRADVLKRLGHLGQGYTGASVAMAACVLASVLWARHLWGEQRTLSIYLGLLAIGAAGAAVGLALGARNIRLARPKFIRGCSLPRSGGYITVWISLASLWVVGIIATIGILTFLVNTNGPH